MKKLVLSALFALPLFSYAQSSWQVLAGTGFGNAIFSTPDSGLVILATTLETTTSNTDVAMIKLDKTGDTTGVWYYGYANKSEYVTGAAQLPDSSYLITGMAGVDSLLFLRLNADGSIWTERSIGYTNAVFGLSGAVNPTHNWYSGTSYLITGQASISPNHNVVTVINTEDDGSIFWKKYYTDDGVEHLSFQTSDAVNLEAMENTIYVCGLVTDTADIFFNAAESFIMKLDSNGNVVWMRSYESGEYPNAVHMIPTSDNYVLLTQADNAGIFVLKVDSSGTTQWSRDYRTSSPQMARNAGAIEIPGNGYLVYASSLVPGLGSDNRSWLLRLDNNGDTLWTRAFDGPFGEFLEDGVMTQNGFAFAGGLQSTSMISPAVYAVTTDSSGMISCHIVPESIEVTNDKVTTYQHTIIATDLTTVSHSDALSAIGYTAILSDPCDILGVYDAGAAAGSMEVFPNPAAELVTFRYELSSAATVSLRLYDMTGRCVAELQEVKQSAGWHQQSMNTAVLAPGVYYYLVHAGEGTQSGKVVIR